MNAKILLSTYVMTMFASATLLFLVQPIVGKLLVPFLGGTPAVWNTCMVFFQAILLMGYLYAHGLSKLAPKKQLMIHLPMIVIAGLMLPIAAPTSIPPQDAPIGWLIGTLFLMIGAPFFAISTTAPLLQSWFSHTDHPTAKDPYHLYAASNLGSMTSLLGYPFLVEPFAALEMQTFGWTIGFVIFALGVALCGVVVIKASQNEAENPQKTQEVVEKPSIKEVLIWILLAFIPSSLVLGTTTYITTDVASIPLLWLVPLALYLLTFIIVFSNRITLNTTNLSKLGAVMVIMAIIIEYYNAGNVHIGLVMGAHMGLLFILSLTSHALLAKRRPNPRYLTAFFLWMSFGGVLGGVFNALVAPFIFSTTLEYWLMIGVAMVGFLWFEREEPSTAKPGKRGLYIGFGLGACLLIIVNVSMYMELKNIALLLGTTFTCLLTLGAVLSFENPRTKWMLYMAVASMGLLLHFKRFHFAGHEQLHLERSFFGVHSVYIKNQLVHLDHGNTSHGTQHVKDRDAPLSYYSRSGPMGQLFERIDAQKRTQHKVAIIGLGAGTLAAYNAPTRYFDFYEIDPVVAKIAQTPKYFTYLQKCGDKCTIHIGDGRLLFQQKAQPKSVDLLVVDAFSSDTIPVHILTKQAMEIYWSKLKDDGLIAFHISNRYFDLKPLLANLANLFGATVYAQEHEPPPKTKGYINPSTWAVMAKDTAVLDELFKNQPQWKKLKVTPNAPLWTDSYTSLLDVRR